MENIPISDTQLLDTVLKWLSPEQMMELCMSFDPKTALGEALYARVDAVREQNKAFDAEAFRREIVATATASENFKQCFWKAVSDYLVEKDIADSQLYKAIGMAQQNYDNHLKKGIQEADKKIWDSHTKHYNALAIGIVLKLNLFELKTLMSSGGHPFDPAVNPRDYVVANCVRKGIYNPQTINDMLMESGLDPLPIYLTLDGELPKGRRKNSKKESKKKEEGK